MADLRPLKRLSQRPAALVLAPALALAPAAQPALAQEADESVTIEEIVVTARRRAESLQQVPISVSAFGANRIEDLQADDISGLQYAVPNVYMERGDGRNAVIYIRGIGQNDSLAFADPGVGVYVDDVFVARSQAAFLELFDVERVEVLRGPQGTLYGRNTIGGAVKFISTTPPDKFDGYLEAGVGNFDFGTVKARIGGPLVDDVLRAKVAMSAVHRSGYADNTVDGKDDGDTKSFAWRAALLLTPSDAFDLRLGFEGRVDRPDTSRSPVRETDVVGFADPVGAPTTPTVFAPNADPYVVDVNANGLSDLTSYGVTLNAEWRVAPAWTLQAITAYRTMDFDLILDTDASPLPILDILVLQDQDQFSQELRTVYDGGGRLTVVGGVYYFHDDDLTFSGVDNASASLFGFPVTLFGLPTSSIAATDQVTDSIAVFADATYRLTDKLSIEAGVRYTYEDKESARDFEFFFDPTLTVVTDPPPFTAIEGAGIAGPRLEGSEDFDAVTPKFALSYQAREDLLLYASVARGFKSGGFDGRGNTEFSFQAFDPEKVWAYEAGLKSSWLDGRLVVNAAYFYNDYTDLQVTSFGSDPVSGTFQSLFTNAAEARTQGIDLEIALRATQALTLNGTVGYLDAEYKEFETLVGGVVTDVSDRALVNAPEWNASAGATYERAITAGLVGALHVDGAYRSKTFNEITASEILAQDEYVIVNAFLSLKDDDGRWEARAGVRNLTDQEIRVQGFNLSEFPGYQLSFFSAPRTYDLRLFLRF